MWSYCWLGSYVVIILPLILILIFPNINEYKPQLFNMFLYSIMDHSCSPTAEVSFTGNRITVTLLRVSRNNCNRNHKVLWLYNHQTSEWRIFVNSLNLNHLRTKLAELKGFNGNWCNHNCIAIPISILSIFML